MSFGDDKDTIFASGRDRMAACECAKCGEDGLLGTQDEARQPQGGTVTVAHDDAGVEMTCKDIAIIGGFDLGEMVALKRPEGPGRDNGLNVEVRWGDASMGIMVAKYQPDLQ